MVFSAASRQEINSKPRSPLTVSAVSLIHGELLPIEIAGNAIQRYSLYIGGIYLDIAADSIKLGIFPYQAINGNISADRGNVKLQCGKRGRADRRTDIFDRQFDTAGDLDGEPASIRAAFHRGNPRRSNGW